MCNAWNHPLNCTCGWGGEGHSGRSTFSDFVPAAQSWWPRALTSTYDSYVNPNAGCPVCGAAVFFYQSPSGGRVFFDELGQPWPKHPCTDNASRPGRLASAPSVSTEAASYARQPSGWQPVGIESITDIDKDFHPRTDNASHPGQLASAPSASTEAASYAWQRSGWQPFAIESIIGIDKDFLKITGILDHQRICLYIQRLVEHHLHTQAFSEKSLAQVKANPDTSHQLSILLPHGVPITLTAFLLLADARSDLNQRIKAKTAQTSGAHSTVAARSSKRPSALSRQPNRLPRHHLLRRRWPLPSGRRKKRKTTPKPAHPLTRSSTGLRGIGSYVKSIRTAKPALVTTRPGTDRQNPALRATSTLGYG